MSILDKFTDEAREVNRLGKRADKIMALESEMDALSDDDLRAKTNEFRNRLESGETLDDILNEAFAVTREAGKRVLGLNAYREQIMGGIAMFEGNIAELKTGEGKAVTDTTPVPTPNGWKLAGQIKVGDYLFDKNGMPTLVIGVFPQGKKQVYEVELKDGRVIPCADEHRWAVYESYDYSKKPLVMVKTTEEMFNEQFDIGRGYKFSLPVNEAVNYPEKDLKINPYVLGIFLGNGCKNATHSFELSSNDMEVVNMIAELTNTKPLKQNGNNYTWHFSKGLDSNGKNIILKIEDLAPEYETLLSEKYSFEKFIPNEYKTGSIAQRWALIQGMMDADGNIYEDKENPRYNIQYSTTSSLLRDDFMEVLYSLGISCKWAFNKIAGQGSAVHDQYQIKINCPNEVKKNFFRLKRKLDIARKAENVIKRKDYSKIAIKEIRKTNRYENQTCFSVDNDEHLFLVGNYVVTHNTLVATMPTYLEALAGKGVHVVTVNEYLSERDASQMGEIYRFLGMSTGVNKREMTAREKQEAFACDITYTTNAELGFDYLRDNMVTNVKDRVLRGLHVAFIDEADSILIDESRTPLIISGGNRVTAQIYEECDKFAKLLEEPKYEFDKVENENKIVSGDFDVDQKTRQIMLTESGIHKAEVGFHIQNLYDPEHTQLVHHINQAIKANFTMSKGVEYVVNSEGMIVLVDQFTGRTMPGRAYSDGLQQAIQAKEGVEIEAETSTLATITYQNFFRLYDKLAGMTGTAKTEEEEFLSTYNMKVVVVPTHRPVIRDDQADLIFIHKASKYEAIVNEAKRLYKTGQPVLIGTIAVETSELLHEMLEAAGVPHEVLNAKNHAREAEIIAKAGQPYSVTIATNMAGRGTDIKLTKQSRDLGGLVVLGSERHESRRIDNQLRGRSGRQGDPGRSQFFVSMEDDLVQRFGGGAVQKMLLKISDDDDAPIQSRTFSKAMTSAQKRAEGYNFDSRKNVLDYDDVLRRQREIVYKERDGILENADSHNLVHMMFDKTVEQIIEENKAKSKNGKISADALCTSLNELGMAEDAQFMEQEILPLKQKEIESYVKTKLWNNYQKMIKPVYNSFMDFEKTLVLKTIDRNWMNHIDIMDKLRNGIHLRSYAQNNPLQQYVEEGFALFEDMNAKINYEVTQRLLYLRITKVEEPAVKEA